MGKLVKNKKLDIFIGLSIILSLILSFIIFPFIGFISYPSTKSIANKYISAVVAGDLETALALSNESCNNTLVDSIKMDISNFGGAELQDLEIIHAYNTGSDESLEFSSIEFDYRFPGETIWRKGKIKIITDHQTVGLRYLCGVIHVE